MGDTMTANMRTRIAKAIGGEVLAPAFDHPDDYSDDVRRRVDVVYATADRVLAALGRTETGRLSKALMLTDEEWEALDYASGQLEVDWRQEGDADQGARYAAFERGRAKIGAWMRPQRAAG